MTNPINPASLSQAIYLHIKETLKAHELTDYQEFSIINELGTYLISDGFYRCLKAAQKENPDIEMIDNALIRYGDLMSDKINDVATEIFYQEYPETHEQIGTCQILEFKR